MLRILSSNQIISIAYSHLHHRIHILRSYWTTQRDFFFLGAKDGNRNSTLLRCYVCHGTHNKTSDIVSGFFSRYLRCIINIACVRFEKLTLRPATETLWYTLRMIHIDVISSAELLRAMNNIRRRACVAHMSVSGWIWTTGKETIKASFKIFKQPIEKKIRKRFQKPAEFNWRTRLGLIDDSSEDSFHSVHDESPRAIPATHIMGLFSRGHRWQFVVDKKRQRNSEFRSLRLIVPVAYVSALFEKIKTEQKHGKSSKKGVNQHQW